MSILGNFGRFWHCVKKKQRILIALSKHVTVSLMWAFGGRKLRGKALTAI